MSDAVVQKRKFSRLPIEAHSVIISTSRLTIRPWTFDDLEAFFAVYGDPKVMEPLLATAIGSLEEARERMAKNFQTAESYPPGLGFWAIERTEDARVVGSLILKPLPQDTRVEVGWHLGSAYWGNGYATEAGGAALRYGFETRGLEEIFAIVRAENEKSHAVCDRIGLKFLELTDRYHDLTLRLYGLTRDEWNISCSQSP